jgi:hypothetical protein
MSEPNEAMKPIAAEAKTVTPIVPPPEPSPLDELPTEELPEREIARKTRRSFFAAALAAGAGYAGWRWLRTRRLDDGVPWPLRRTLEFNEGLARDFLDAKDRAREYPYEAAPSGLRINGGIGLSDGFDPAAWRLHVTGLAAGPTTLTLDDIKALPRVAVAMRLCCIEGWSCVVNWAGVRFRDYVSLTTPDGGYYVGLDIASALHPQTLLCYEMDGQPLTLAHGAPLRLVIPTKYGVKNIKRIGHIRFTGVRPADYWAQQGYDWYAGL